MTLSEERHNQIISYVYGDLTGEDRRAFEELLLGDPMVRAEVEGLQATRDLLEQDMVAGETHGFDTPPAHLKGAIFRTEALVRPKEVRAAANATKKKPAAGIWERLGIYLGGGGILAAAATVFLVSIQTQDASREAPSAAKQVMFEKKSAAKKKPSSDSTSARNFAKDRIVEIGGKKEVTYLEGRLVDELVVGKNETKKDRSLLSASSDRSKAKVDAKMRPAPAVPPDLDQLVSPESESDMGIGRLAGRGAASGGADRVRQDRHADSKINMMKGERTASPQNAPAEAPMAPMAKSARMEPQRKLDDAMEEAAKEDSPSFAAEAHPAQAKAMVGRAASSRSAASPAEGPPRLSTKESAFIRKKRSSKRLAPQSKGQKRQQELNKMVQARELGEEDFTLVTANRELSAGHSAEALSLFLSLARNDPSGKKYGLWPTVGQMKALQQLNRCRETSRLFPRIKKAGLKAKGAAEGYWVMAQCAEKMNQKEKANAYYSALLAAPRFQKAAEKRLKALPAP